MARSRWILAVLVLLLGAGALWLVLRASPGGRERSGSRARTSATPASEAGAEPGPATLHASDSSVPAPVPAPDSARAPVTAESVSAESRAAAAGGRTWSVTVVEAGSLAPVPGAAVWVKVGGNPDPLALGELVEQEAPYRADAAGLVLVPASAENRLLVARAGTLTGSTRVEDSATTTAARIELHPDFDVTVEVRHAGGAPAKEVEVALSFPPAPRWKSFSQTTDAEGRATFAHAGLRMSVQRETAGEVRVQRALDEPLVAAFDPLRPPRAPLVFVLPACATVSVRLTGTDGAPVADGTRLALAHLSPGTERDVSPFAHGEREYLRATTREGVARFECVELGGELEVLVYSGTQDVVLRAFLPAPSRAGAHEEHALRLGLTHPVLVFRLLDDLGSVMANEEVSLRFVQRSGWNHGDHTRAETIDATGHLRVALVDPFREGDKRQLTVGARGDTIGALLDLARTFEPGENQMGDLQLVVPPLLVAGRVLDGEGKGLEAGLALHYPLREEDGRMVWYWREWERLLASDADGTFEVRGFLEESVFRLQATAKDMRSEMVEAARGARGVELRLLRAGWIAGNVILDEGTPFEGIQLSLRPSGSVGNVPEQQEMELPSDGRFQFTNLAPGRYDLALSVRGSQGVASVEGLAVPPGAACTDARLAIDLRGRLHWMRFVLVPDKPGAELSGNLQYWSSEGTGEREQQYHWFDGSPVDLLAHYERIDLLLSVPGFRPVRLTGVSTGQEIALQRALTARLQLPPDVRLPDPPLYVKATLVVEGEEAGLDFGGAAFDERREITCKAPGPGRLLVRWIAEKRGSNGASATTMQGIPEQYVELAEDAGEPLFVLAIDDATLQEGLAKSGL